MRSPRRPATCRSEETSFVEIGRKLGITPQGAAYLYNRAIRKLRSADPTILFRLQELSSELERARSYAGEPREVRRA